MFKGRFANWLLLIAFLFGPTAAEAACASYPNLLSNGYVANADQVMANFGCAALTSGSTIENLTSTSGEYFAHGTDSFAGFDNTLGLHSNHFLYLQGDPSGGLWLAGSHDRTDGIVVRSATHELDFYLNNGFTPAVVINSGGNLGIGITSPLYKLDIHGAAAGTSTARIEDSVRGAWLYFAKATTGFLGVGSSGMWLNDTSADATIAAYSPNLRIYTNGNPTERVRIDSTGRVGIGTTSPAQMLEVNGQVKVDALASASGTTLCINANVLASCSSSRRYKENIHDAGFGLKEVEAMRPVSFKWKGRDEQDFGLVAEEVAKIDPRYVTYKAGKIEGVKYPQLTAVLVNAVKELKAANDSQAAEIERLRQQNTALFGQIKQQSVEAQEVRKRLGSLERKVSVHTAENLAVTRH